MPRTRNPYPTEFRGQIVELHGAGRSAEDLAREFEPCVATIHTWIKQASRQSHGGRCIHAELADGGVHVGHKRFEKLMKAAGLVGVSRRRDTQTTIRDDRVRPSANLVDGNFYAGRPNMLWVADITYVPTWVSSPPSTRISA